MCALLGLRLYYSGVPTRGPTWWCARRREEGLLMLHEGNEAAQLGLAPGAPSLDLVLSSCWIRSPDSRVSKSGAHHLMHPVS